MWVKPSAGDMAWMLEQITADKVRVVIDSVYPFEQIDEAFAQSEKGHAHGKIVVTMP